MKKNAVSANLPPSIVEYNNSAFQQNKLDQIALQFLVKNRISSHCVRLNQEHQERSETLIITHLKQKWGKVH